MTITKAAGLEKALFRMDGPTRHDKIENTQNHHQSCSLFPYSVFSMSVASVAQEVRF